MDLSKLAFTRAQECVSRVPVIVLGSGASVPHGVPGMGPLGDHLRMMPLPDGLPEKDTADWAAFCAKLPAAGLEAALTEVPLSEVVTEHVVRTTWAFLNTSDLQIFNAVVANHKLLPLTRLYQYLFKSTAAEVQVVTPNYDRVAEYAAEVGGFCAYTGFTFGMLAHRAQHAAPKVMSAGKQTRTVNVWKVHGSFSWFRDDDGVVVSLPPMLAPPPGLVPVIVTPGIDKYRRTHDEPFRTTMQNADIAIRAAPAFLCVGYGFNDEHLQPLLVERCRADNVPLVLITRTISPKAHEFFKSGKCQQYMAIEDSPAGAKVFSNEVPDGQELAGKPIWQLGEFLSLVM